MGVKEKWLVGDVLVVWVILEEVFKVILNFEEIVLVVFKLEFENNEFRRVRIFLVKVREIGIERVWMKLVIVERELGNYEEEKVLFEEGLIRFFNFYKFWLMLG